MPFPGETVLIFTGILLAQEKMEMLPAILVTTAGATTGALLAYRAGRRYGTGLSGQVTRYLRVRQAYIDRVELWFRKHQNAVLLVGRFVPGVRPLSAYIGGMLGVPFWKFSLLMTAGYAIWCTAYILVGLNVGRNWGWIASFLIDNWLSLALLAMFAAILIVAMRRKRNSQ
ncbi:MAG: DedA family protein [Bacillota bacterium]